MSFAIFFIILELLNLKRYRLHVCVLEVVLRQKIVNTIMFGAHDDGLERWYGIHTYIHDSE